MYSRNYKTRLTPNGDPRNTIEIGVDQMRSARGYLERHPENQLPGDPSFYLFENGNVIARSPNTLELHSLSERGLSGLARALKLPRVVKKIKRGK